MLADSLCTCSHDTPGYVAMASRLLARSLAHGRRRRLRPMLLPLSQSTTPESDDASRSALQDGEGGRGPRHHASASALPVPPTPTLHTPRRPTTTPADINQARSRSPQQPQNHVHPGPLLRLLAACLSLQQRLGSSARGVVLWCVCLGEGQVGGGSVTKRVELAMGVKRGGGRVEFWEGAEPNQRTRAHTRQAGQSRAQPARIEASERVLLGSGGPDSIRV